MSRLLLVSNRLPVTARFEKGGLKLERSAGGLAAGLAGPHEESGGVWIGWPGQLPRTTAAQRRKLDETLRRQRISPVYMSGPEVKAFYEDVSNAVIWPILHYRIDQLPMNPTGWGVFRRVSERFARAAIEAYQPGDTIWVHDYQLVLVPQLIRQALPEARIGFFLHVPFPPSDVFSVVPWRQEILQGIVGADLVGFHTPEYALHFLEACHQILKLPTSILRLPTSVGAVLQEHRQTSIGSFPLGVDNASWAELASSLSVIMRSEEIRREAHRRSIVLGIDRLDYTKGLVHRLTAIELLFEAEPRLAQRLRFIQVIVPSRESVESYSALKRRVDEIVGRINGRFGTTAAAPIHVLSRNLLQEEVASLYVAADIMLVTPLRDGMNLVAKEFIASRQHDDGVLILSEFAGAARELPDAILVNPYDVEDLARSLRQALEMPRRERAARMRRLRAQVAANDAHLWTESFLTALDAAAAHNASWAAQDSVAVG